MFIFVFPLTYTQLPENNDVGCFLQQLTLLRNEIKEASAVRSTYFHGGSMTITTIEQKGTKTAKLL